MVAATKEVGSGPVIYRVGDGVSDDMGAVDANRDVAAIIIIRTRSMSDHQLFIAGPF